MLDNDVLAGVGGLSKHSLTHILYIDDSQADTDSVNVVKHSPYIEQDEFIKIWKLIRMGSQL